MGVPAKVGLAAFCLRRGKALGVTTQSGQKSQGTVPETASLRTPTASLESSQNHSYF